MANHGLCKNCWWWQRYPFTRAVGLCFMQASDKGVLGKPALSCDYCPDYDYSARKPIASAAGNSPKLFIMFVRLNYSLYLVFK